MNEFHNPYHFVPIKNDYQIDDLSVKDFNDRQNMKHAAHDRFLPGTYSGRLICRLTTETPIFIGHERTSASDTHPAEVRPFEIEGKPAIPASSLRGLVSSIAEAASNSALRVLKDTALSYRADYRKQSLSALGMIVDREENGVKVRRLRPLTLPTLKPERGRYIVPAEYRRLFNEYSPLLKVYLPAYKGSATFFARNNPYSYSSDVQQFWYLKLSGVCSLNTDFSVKIAPDHDAHIKNNFLIGQKAAPGASPITKEAYDKLGNKDGFVRGILRVLGIEGREKEMPKGKTHEIFIPYQDKIEERLPLLDAEDAVREFESLAEQRTEVDKDLPFHVKGSRRNDNPQRYGQNIRLRDGDIVFFELDECHLEKVGHISISSIWRRKAGGTTHDFFREISPELLPFNRNRKVITIAEQLFGFVEQNKVGKEDESTRALKGRVRFSHALFDRWEDKIAPTPADSYYLNPVTLKILDSPKLPSPALYFKKRSGSGYIAKRDLSTSLHDPQGRKIYLHQPPAGEPWKTEPQPADPCRPDDRCKQKVRITPIRSNAVFCFHIDFNNLSENELGLLFYAIQPNATFRHKIGMGKPIGLGTIRISPVGIFLIDRHARYRLVDIKNMFSAQRYDKARACSESNLNALPDRYEREKSEYTTMTSACKLLNLFEENREKFEKQMNKDIKTALKLLGEPDRVMNPVHYPQVGRVFERGKYRQLIAEEMEQESYRWFVANDSGSGKDNDYLKGPRKDAEKESLEPLGENSKNMPTLKRYDWNG